ncbi:hypothetical protein BSL78_20688 [Apostichopus japonicus]|uniref:Uncharacterized protein n=1 Tax=Stichopus japonicus TaxID=307972 RepID=A0A2G8K3C7_STIJA|nr:hypothetical protein BSL78_20688 [Apostichopus japonicus]
MIQKENVIPNEEPTLQLQELTKFIQADVILVSCSPEKLEVSVSSSMFVDGNMVMKDIQICDGTWTLKVLSWAATSGICTCCKKLPSLNLGKDVILDEDDDSDISKILESYFPNASPEMKVLLKSQHGALKTKSPNGRKWDKEIISLCLSLWLRNPQAYQDLKDSNYLVLPSGRHLRRYKNIVKQRSGIQEAVFHWMYEAANDAHIAPDGRAGLLNHDETKIQEDLVIEMDNGKPKLMVG